MMIYGTLEQLLKYPNNGLREEELFIRFSAPFEIEERVNGSFYDASPMFFRNLTNYLEQFSEIRLDQETKQSLLKWEEECNKNQIVINILAYKLNSHYSTYIIKLYLLYLFWIRTEKRTRLRQFCFVNQAFKILKNRPRRIDNSVFQDIQDQQFLKFFIKQENFSTNTYLILHDELYIV